jgi:hypothetical protein
VLIQSREAQVNETVPEIVRIGVANACIKCVTRQRVEYINEAGQECFVDLEECAKKWAKSLTEEDEEDEGDDDFVLLTPEDSARRKRRHVGGRGLLEDPPWIEFANSRRTRFEFESLNEGYGLIIPLKKVRLLTLDMN